MLNKLKYLALATTLPLLSVITNVHSANVTSYSAFLPKYDVATGLVNLPAIEVNGHLDFRDIKLKINSDGTLSVVDIGDIESFELQRNYFYSNRVGTLQFSEKGEIVEITGVPNRFNNGSSYSNNEMTEFKFSKATDNLLDPYTGKKGTHYLLDLDGNVVYATPLGKVLDGNYDIAAAEVDIVEDKNDPNLSSIYKNAISVGDLIVATDNTILEITGVTGSPGRGYSSYSQLWFYKTPANFPEPKVGIKGGYFSIGSYGDIVYVNKK